MSTQSPVQYLNQWVDNKRVINREMQMLNKYSSTLSSALRDLDEQGYRQVAAQIFAQALWRFPILAELARIEQKWTYPRYLVELSLEIHNKHWDISDDDVNPLGTNRISDELGTCFVGYLRKSTLSQEIKKFHAGLDRNQATKIRLAHKEWFKILSEFESGAVQVNEGRFPRQFLRVMLKIVQLRRYETENDMQLWDFLATASNLEGNIISESSWKLKEIADAMNDDSTIPQLEPWNDDSVTNIRDRLLRFIRNEIKSASSSPARDI